MVEETSAPAPAAPPRLDLASALIASEEEKSELDKVLELLLDPANIAHNTELSRNEILAFSVLSTLAKRHNLPVLKEFLRENLILRVSKGRGGRKELVKMVGRYLAQEDQTGMRGMDDPQKSRFFRRRR